MNLEGIAKLSGVSRSTVSRVINNDPNVNDVTREKIMQVVRWVNYTPNAASRGLAAFARSQLTSNLAKTNSDINYNCPRFITF